MIIDHWSLKQTLYKQTPSWKLTKCLKYKYVKVQSNSSHLCGQYILFIQNIYKKTNSFTEAASVFFFIALFGFTVGALHSAETATQTLNCGKALTFPPILLFQLDKTSITLVNNRTISLIKHNFHRGSQRPSSGDAETRDPGLGTELQHRRDLTRWPLSHSIIQPISQAYNRERWKWRAGKACSRAPLQRSLWHCGCVGPSINTISGRISNNTRTSAVHLHHQGFTQWYMQRFTAELVYKRVTISIILCQTRIVNQKTLQL